MRLELQRVKKATWAACLLDGEPWRTMHRDLRRLLPPHLIQKVQDEEEALEVFRGWELRGAMGYLGQQLSQRDYLSNQLEERLVRREVSPPVCQEALEKCLAQGWIDDRRWIDAFVRGQARRLQGPRIVRQKLLQRGAPAHWVEERLAPLREEETQRNAVMELLQRKYAQRDLSDHRERFKVMAALQRRGYSPDLIQEVIRWKSGYDASSS